MSIIPEKAVVEVMNERITNLRTAHNLFRGPVRPPAKGKIPDEAVFVMDTGGFEPTPCIDGATGDYLLFCNVQVRVRSCANDYCGGRDLAEEVIECLRKFPINGRFAQIIGSEPRESCPIYLGRSALEHHEWSMNLIVWIIQKVTTEEC